MPDPNSHDFNPDDFDDSDIEELLASKYPLDRTTGLTLLDAKKRDKFCGLLRIWSNNRCWRLTGADIAEIWEATMVSISKNVHQGRFKNTGKLNAYIRKIVHCRATDFLRKRIWIDDDADPQSVASWRLDAEHPSAAPKYIDNVKSCIKKLPERQKRVLEHHLHLCNDSDGKWPSPDDLCAAVNGDGRKILPRDAIMSARKRALAKLRKIAIEEY